MLSYPVNMTLGNSKKPWLKEEEEKIVAYSPKVFLHSYPIRIIFEKEKIHSV